MTSVTEIQASSLFAPSDRQWREISELQSVAGVTEGTIESLSAEQEIEKWKKALVAHRTCWLIEEQIELPCEREVMSVMACLRELHELGCSVNLKDKVVDDAVTQNLAEIAKGDNKFALIAQDLFVGRSLAK